MQMAPRVHVVVLALLADAAGATAVAVPIGPRPYNASMAEPAAYLAVATYCGDAAVTNWTCEACARAAAPVEGTSVVYVADNASGLHAYIGHLRLKVPAVDGRDDALVVAFRGTDSSNIHNWIIDLMIGQMSPYQGCPGCGVHSGFYAAWTALSEHVVNSLDDFARASHPRPPPILVTGHSLGSALATLAAYELSLGGYPVRRVVTFGSPRVGNDAFAAAYDVVVLHGVTAWAQVVAGQTSRLRANHERGELRGKAGGHGGEGATAMPPLRPSALLRRALERSASTPAAPSKDCWSVQDEQATTACGADVVRVVNASDVVVHLMMLGYRHPPREVWYPNGSTAAYVECSPVDGAFRRGKGKGGQRVGVIQNDEITGQDRRSCHSSLSRAAGEDASCADSVGLPLSIEDHLWYLGKKFGKNNSLCVPTGGSVI
jgi:hypothetical protein